MNQHARLAKLALRNHKIVTVTANGKVVDRDAICVFRAATLLERYDFSVRAQKSVADLEIFRFDLASCFCGRIDNPEGMHVRRIE